MSHVAVPPRSGLMSSAFFLSRAVCVGSKRLSSRDQVAQGHVDRMFTKKHSTAPTSPHPVCETRIYSSGTMLNDLTTVEFRLAPLPLILRFWWGVSEQVSWIMYDATAKITILPPRQGAPDRTKIGTYAPQMSRIKYRNQKLFFFHLAP